jgi:predicted nucleic acid-binding protein
LKYLLDTCVVIEFLNDTPDIHVHRWLGTRKSRDLFMSAMTWAELERGIVRLSKSKRKSELEYWFQRLEAGFEDRVLAFDKNVAQCWAQMVVDVEKKGKTIPAFDSIVAATAKAHACSVVTRNVRDFENAGVNIINPWELN